MQYDNNDHTFRAGDSHMIAHGIWIEYLRIPRKRRTNYVKVQIRDYPNDIKVDTVKIGNILCDYAHRAKCNVVQKPNLALFEDIVAPIRKSRGCYTTAQPPLQMRNVGYVYARISSPY